MIPVTNLRPFTRMLMTIGQIPTSYLISMSYEEQLLWLCNYLEKEVIPALNNNAEAVKEVQELYTELKSYVDNYFDNLDVQEEINNKLDEMAESGQLADIIAQYVQLTSTYTYDTISDLKSATNLFDGANVRTNGYYSIGDDGGAFYHVREVLNSDVIDNGSIISLNDNNLVAELITKDVNIEMFGIDDDIDNTTQIQRAISYAKNKTLYLMNKTYYISSTINLDNNKIIGNNTVIKANDDFNSNYMITLTNSNELYNITFDNNNKSISTNKSDTTDSKIVIENCNFIHTKKDVDNNNFAMNSAFYLTSKESIVKNSNFYDNYSHGLRLISTQNNSTALIDNCKFYNNGTYNSESITACGLVEYGKTVGDNYNQVTITNCEAYNNQASGIAPHSLHNCYVNNCYAYDNNEHGISLMDGTDGVIENCTCKNNSGYGLRVQGDYLVNDSGYKNFKLINNTLLENSGIFIDNNIEDGIIANNIISCSSGTKFGIVIGKSDNLTDNIKNIIIANNNVFGNGIKYNDMFFFRFVLDKSNQIYGNKYKGTTNNTYYIDGDYRASWITPELNYSNNYNDVSVTPSDMSLWTAGGSRNGHTFTPSENIVCRRQFIVSGTPKFVNIIMDKEAYSPKLSLGLRFRNGGGTLINFTNASGTTQQLTNYAKVNSNLISRVIDLTGYTFSDTVGQVEVYIQTETNTDITINNIYVSYSNDNTVINSLQ